MILLPFILLAFVVNVFLGAVILSAIDTDGSLFRWYRSAPHPSMQFVVLTFWPVVAYFHLHDYDAWTLGYFFLFVSIALMLFGIWAALGAPA